MAQQIEVGRAIGTPCQGCGRPMWKVKHEKSGLLAPLAYPSERMVGNINVYQHEGEWVYHVLSKQEREAGETGEFISHFADCPKASQFRPKAGAPA